MKKKIASKKKPAKRKMATRGRKVKVSKVTQPSVVTPQPPKLPPGIRAVRALGMEHPIEQN